MLAIVQTPAIDNGYIIILVTIAESKKNDANTIVEKINEGKIHIVEPGLLDAVREVVSSGNLKAAPNPCQADVFILCVPTPFKKVKDVFRISIASQSLH